MYRYVGNQCFCRSRYLIGCYVYGTLLCCCLFQNYFSFIQGCPIMLCLIGLSLRLEPLQPGSPAFFFCALFMIIFPSNQFRVYPHCFLKVLWVLPLARFFCISIIMLVIPVFYDMISQRGKIAKTNSKPNKLRLLSKMKIIHLLCCNRANHEPVVQSWTTSLK